MASRIVRGDLWDDSRPHLLKNEAVPKNHTMAAAAFLDLLRSGPPTRFVANLETRMTRVILGDAVLPCTINDGAPTCYICCPSRAYIDYARWELRALRVPRSLEAATRPLFWVGMALVRVAGLDRQVQPNNWLIATNPAPQVGIVPLADMVSRIVADHPRHVIVWRSLDARSDGGLLDIMRAAGWVLLPARLVYVIDCRRGAPKTGRDEARDKATLATSAYAIVDGADFDAEDFDRAAALYALLYLEKYTPLNPHYTAAFIAGLVRAGLLDVKGLRSQQGRLDGIIGFFDGGPVMTAPIVGYDTALPQADGLYRMLMAIAFDRARSRRMLFNASAGADSFKRNRGAVPVLEYSAIYNRHLPLPRRIALAILAALLTRIAVPLFRRYGA